MKTTKWMVVSAVSLVLLLSVAAVAQHTHPGQKKTATSGMDKDMAAMMQSPHHKLMMAYMKSMSAFASALHEQVQTEAPDIEAARATISELRHNLNAMDALHEKHMQSMSAEMQTKMQPMMQMMQKEHGMVKEHVSALETTVQAEKPDVVQLRNHATALNKQLQMMSKMHGSKAGKTTSKKM